MSWREWNWGYALIVTFLIVILSLEVANYIHIQNNAVQLNSQMRSHYKDVQDKIESVIKSTTNFENLTQKAIKDVSSECVSVFREILSH